MQILQKPQNWPIICYISYPKCSRAGELAQTKKKVGPTKATALTKEFTTDQESQLVQNCYNFLS